MNRIFQVDVAVLAFLVGSVAPLVTALATKITAGSRYKALVNLVVSVALGVLSAVVAVDGKFTLLQAASGGIAAYLASGVTYRNLWKPTGLSGGIANSTADFGLGQSWDKTVG